MGLTKQKTAISRVVMNSDCHLTAEEIYNRVKQEIPGISLATVYRNLNIMVENGEILRLKFIDGTCRYDRTTRRHAHGFCTVCHAVWDIDPRALTVNGLFLPPGFQIVGYDTTVKGVCSKCRS